MSTLLNNPYIYYGICLVIGWAGVRSLTRAYKVSREHPKYPDLVWHPLLWGLAWIVVGGLLAARRAGWLPTF